MTNKHDLLLQGLGTDDRALIRIMVSRSEVDLFNIRKEFKETHDVSLHEFIQVETMIVSLSLRHTNMLAKLIVFSSYLRICHVILLFVFFLYCLFVALCEHASADPSQQQRPSNAAAVVRWWGTIIYSFLQWTAGMWLPHSCLGISLTQLPLHICCVIGWWLQR